MKNLDNIIDEELDLDEGIFSQKVKGAVSRGADTMFGSGAKKRKEQGKVEKGTQQQLLKTQQKSNADPSIRIRQHLVDVKKRLYNSLAGAVLAYEKASGQNEADKMADKKFVKYRDSALTLRSDMDKKFKSLLGEGVEEQEAAHQAKVDQWAKNQNTKKTKQGNAKKLRNSAIPPVWDELMIFLKNPEKNLEAMKKSLNTVGTELKQKTFFQSQDSAENDKEYSWERLAQSPNMVADYIKSDDFNKLNNSTKDIVRDLHRYNEIFNPTVKTESFTNTIFNNMLNELNHDQDAIKDAQLLINNYFTLSSEASKVLSLHNPEFSDYIKAWVDGIEDEGQKKHYQKLVDKYSAKEKEAKEEDGEEEDGEEDGGDVTADDASQQDEKGNQEIKNQDAYDSILKYYEKSNLPLTDESKKIAIAVANKYGADRNVSAIATFLADNKIADKQILQLPGNKKPMTKKELWAIINKIDDSINYPNNLINEKIELSKLIPKIEKFMSQESSNKDDGDEKDDDKVDKTAALVKKKIGILMKKYDKSSNQEKFNQLVNKALKSIGLHDEEKNNATKLLNWLKIAGNSALRVESFDIDYELYKEDIIDIMLYNQYIL